MSQCIRAEVTAVLFAAMGACILWTGLFLLQHGYNTGVLVLLNVGWWLRALRETDVAQTPAPPDPSPTPPPYRTAGGPATPPRRLSWWRRWRCGRGNHAEGEATLMFQYRNGAHHVLLVRHCVCGLTRILHEVYQRGTMEGMLDPQGETS